MAAKSVSISNKIIALTCLLVLSACNPVKWVKTQLQGETPKSAASSGVPAQETGPEAMRNAKVNAELLREMYVVVLGNEPKSRGEFGNMVDTLNQGASLEGVYNGLTHSAAYRKLETENPGASGEALRIFSEELAVLQLELKEPTEYNGDSAKPLPMPVTPSAEGPQALAFPKKGLQTSPASSEKPEGAAAAAFSKTFSGASLYTLKRILADEALRVIQAKRSNRQELASWYGKWVVRIVGRKVDFGIAQRNYADEVFHGNWARGSGEDQLIWEVLNRLHRVLNEANRKKN